MYELVEAPKVLLVDDEPKQLAALEKLLAQLKLSIYKASTGGDAIALAKQHDFILVLLDIKMPDMNGYDVLENLSWDEKTRHMPVILVGDSQTTESHKIKSYRSGAVDFLNKPINKDTLRGKVSVFLELYEQRNQYLALQQRYESILNAAGEGVIGLDPEGLITFLNPTAAELLGYEKKQLINKPFSLIQSNNTHIAEACKDGKLLKEENSHFVNANRKSLPVEYTVTPLKNANQHYSGAVVVFSDITLRKQAEKQLTQLALYDHLTKLPNRALFEKLLAQSLSRAERNHTMMAVMFLDLDGFKNINDTLGHDMGDQLLQGVGSRLQAGVRGSDIVARLSGDEFAIILDKIDHPEDAAFVAEKIIKQFSTPFQLNKQNVSAGTSIGIALYPVSAKDGKQLTKNADVAMYRAKQQRSNSYRFFSNSMDEKSVRRLNLMYALREALEKDEFSLCYQPRLDINSKKIPSVEVLLRWKHPQFGFIMPDEFIPIAEELGLMNKLNYWILETSCKQLKQWLKGNFDLKYIAINFSPTQLAQGDLLVTLKEILKKIELPPQHIEIELTETSIISDPERMAEILKELREWGAHISVDDFGTGYSSFSYLRIFSLDTLKIDQTFIKGLPSNNNDLAIVRSVISLANDLNINIIAEGVETEEQLACLKENNCHQIQGHLFSEALDVDSMTAFLEKNC